MEKISAIIACYGDELAVPVMYERLKNVFMKIDVDYEIVFVNDHSPDNAAQVLAELASRDSKVTVINRPKQIS